MRTTKLQKILIGLRLGWVTLWVSSWLLFLALINKCPRQKVDVIVRKWATKLLRIVKVKYKVFNPHHVTFSSSACYVIMSNHRSHFDIPLIFVAFPHGSIRMLAKKELFKVPIWGQALKKTEFFSIDRENAKQAQQDLQLAQEKMHGGIIPWVAPEGTRSRDGKLQRFKKGGFILALESQATIIPVGICGSEKILPAKTFDFSLGEEIAICIAEPIATSAYTIRDLRKLMVLTEERIRTAIEQCQ